MMSHGHDTIGLAFCSVLQRWRSSSTQYILDSNPANAISSTDYISEQGKKNNLIFKTNGSTTMNSRQ